MLSKLALKQTTLRHVCIYFITFFFNIFCTQGWVSLFFEISLLFWPDFIFLWALVFTSTKTANRSSHFLSLLPFSLQRPVKLLTYAAGLPISVLRCLSWIFKRLECLLTSVARGFWLIVTTCHSAVGIGWCFPCRLIELLERERFFLDAFLGLFLYFFIWFCNYFVDLKVNSFAHQLILIIIKLIIK